MSLVLEDADVSNETLDEYLASAPFAVSSLRLARMKLEDIFPRHRQVPPLSSLTRLQLVDNSIKTISPHTSLLTALTDMDLSGNMIDQLSLTLCRMSSLKRCF